MNAKESRHWYDGACRERRGSSQNVLTRRRYYDAGDLCYRRGGEGEERVMQVNAGRRARPVGGGVEGAVAARLGQQASVSWHRGFVV